MLPKLTTQCVVKLQTAKGAMNLRKIFGLCGIKQLWKIDEFSQKICRKNPSR